MKTLTLYSPIINEIAAEFVTNLSNVEAGEDVTVRISSPGGSVFAGWGMIAALQECKGNVTLKVDGHAASMAFYMLLFADNVEALDVSSFMIHRAAGNAQTAEEQNLLDNVNAQLKAKMLEKIDSNTFESVTGVSIDAMFTAEKRKDVWMSAKDAKKIGLVSKITRLSASEQKVMKKNGRSFQFCGRDWSSRGRQ